MSFSDFQINRLFREKTPRQVISWCDEQIADRTNNREARRIRLMTILDTLRLQNAADQRVTHLMKEFSNREEGPSRENDAWMTDYFSEHSYLELENLVQNNLGTEQEVFAAAAVSDYMDEQFREQIEAVKREAQRRQAVAEPFDSSSSTLRVAVQRAVAGYIKDSSFGPVP